MPHLTDHTSSNSILVDLTDTHFPFKAEMTFTPSENLGRRFVTIRDGQKVAVLIEEELAAAGWNIADIKFIPQFGQFSAKLVVYGFVSPEEETFLSTLERKNPTNGISLIHSNSTPGVGTGIVSGPSGGSLSYGQTPTADTKALVQYIKTYLESDSTYIGSVVIIDKIEAHAVSYGRGGRTFP